MALEAGMFFVTNRPDYMPGVILGMRDGEMLVAFRRIDVPFEYGDYLPNCYGESVLIPTPALLVTLGARFYYTEHAVQLAHYRLLNAHQDWVQG